MGFPDVSDHFINAVHHTEKLKEFDQQMQATSVAMGALDESQVSGILASALAQIKKQHSSQEEKRKQTTQDILNQALLNYIDDLNRDIAGMEAGFAAQYGDAWREQIALRILGEDDIPQQRADETIEQYRERLEKLLVEELLNEDGSIKDQYKNDPELNKYAEWAQKIYNRNAALALTNEQTQEMVDVLERQKNSEQNNYAADALEGNEEKQKAVLNVDKNHRHANGDNEQSNFDNSFLKPIG